MDLKLKLKLIHNQANGQTRINLPKKEFSDEIRNKLKKFKTALVTLEGFE